MVCSSSCAQMRQQKSGIIAMGGATAGCEGDNVPPLLWPRRYRGGTMKMIYSSQFRLFSGFVRVVYYFVCYSISILMN